MECGAPDNVTIDAETMLSSILQNMDMAGIVLTCMAADTGQQT